MQAHSQYSLKYGVLTPEEIILWGKNNQFPYMVLTDINTSGAVLLFIQAAKKHGVNTSVGIDFRNDLKKCYTIIAKNNRGFHEVNSFLSQHLHHQKAFPKTPPHLGNCWIIYPSENQPKKLKENEWYGVSLQDLNRLKIDRNPEKEAKTVLLQAMTFRNRRDYNAHRLLRAIHYNTLLSKLENTQQATVEDRFLGYEAIQQIWEDFPVILKNTNELHQHCHVHFEFEDAASPQNLASYTGSKAEDLALLKKLCQEGASYRYPILTEAVTQRIDKEIEIIAQKDYLSYFLITWDFTSYARSKGYFYVGRGSGANSIVAYILRITDVDPLELDLYFERFINLYRKNPPDFDIDFSWRNRDDITQYIFQRYPNAALLCTFHTFQYRGTIRELGKVFGLPKSEIDLLTRTKIDLEKLDEISKLVIKYSHYIHGFPSHLSVHAGGIVISEKPITWYSATFLPPKGYPTTQFSMREAEDVGLFKFDVLSQRGLGKIQESLEIIAYHEPHREPHDLHDIAFLKEDEKVKALLLSARAMGCFYVESPAMRMLMTKLKVETYLDLVAASSIIRPGVAQSGMMREYILRHRYPEKRKSIHPLLQEIMPETYGVMVYQEDVIKVAHFFAGLSLAEADVLRRGMSGKFRSADEILQVKQRFLSQCLEKGHDEAFSKDVWRQIESFAGYAFSKGHSASYAVESYQSLYLKAHYPLAFMTAVINNFGGYYRTEVYVHEARSWGAEIEAPSINEGGYACTLVGNRLILGFNLVENIEQELIIKLIDERNTSGKFKNFEQLMKRINIPLEQLLIIIRIGGLRDFAESRKELLWKAHFYHHHRKKKAQELNFEIEHKKFELPQLKEHPLELAFEQMELLGFPLCNPFELLKTAPKNFILGKALEQHLSQKVEMYGYLISLKASRTKQGESMYFGTFIDQEGMVIDTVHFPAIGKQYPFQGKGIYHLIGVVTVEFNYYALEVGMMFKMPFQEDVRFSHNT